MRTLFLFSCIVILGANFATAQPGGGIALSADTQGIDCNLRDNAVGLCTYFIVHVPIPGSIGAATASQFSATQSSCLRALWLSDTAIFAVTIGNSQQGVAIGYGGCTTLPVHVLTMNYFCQALTPSCCRYVAQPDYTVPSGQIEATDCNFVIRFGIGMCANVNADSSCPCWATPVENSTWGKVKELYAE